MEYEIRQDEAADNPRTEWDHLGTILYTSHRYLLGDRRVAADEIDQVVHDNDNICLPVYAYIHGGVALSTGPFTCPWDSGQCGVIYTTKAKALEWYDKEELTPELVDKAMHDLKAEVEELNQYFGGEVVEWVMLDDDGSIVDSCGGYYDREHAEADAKASLAIYMNERAKRNEIEVTCLGELEDC